MSRGEGVTSAMGRDVYGGSQLKTMPAPRAASIRVLVLDNLVGLKIPS